MTDLRTALEAIEDIARHRTDDSAWHDVRVIARAALVTPTPDDRDREPGTLFDVEWWQRNLSTRNGSDRAMAEFIVQTLDFAWPFVSTMRHPDDRDREVERAMHVAFFRATGDDPGPHATGNATCQQLVRELALLGFGLTRLDAGLRASGGNE